MKRKQLILTTVLLACVAAVVVPFWERIWMAVAYEKENMNSYGTPEFAPFYQLVKRAVCAAR